MLYPYIVHTLEGVDYATAVQLTFPIHAGSIYKLFNLLLSQDIKRYTLDSSFV